jgi:hypothetical protein
MDAMFWFNLPIDCPVGSPVFNVWYIDWLSPNASANVVNWKAGCYVLADGVSSPDVFTVPLSVSASPANAGVYIINRSAITMVYSGAGAGPGLFCCARLHRANDTHPSAVIVHGVQVNVGIS